MKINIKKFLKLPFACSSVLTLPFLAASCTTKNAGSTDDKIARINQEDLDKEVNKVIVSNPKNLFANEISTKFKDLVFSGYDTNKYGLDLVTLSVKSDTEVVLSVQIYQKNLAKNKSIVRNITLVTEKQQENNDPKPEVISKEMLNAEVQKISVNAQGTYRQLNNDRALIHFENADLTKYDVVINDFIFKSDYEATLIFKVVQKNLITNESDLRTVDIAVEPEVPFIPNFPINPSVSENDKYPAHASLYNAISVDNENELLKTATIYKEIYDRTFSIQTLTRLNNVTTGNNLLASDQGTAWLLDYAKEANKVKMFLATNLHVIANMSNSWGDQNDQKLGYVDPTGNSVAGFALGKSTLPNNYDFAKQVPNKDKTRYPMQYFANHDAFLNSSTGFRGSANLTAKTVFENPKVVFAALDFMKREAVSEYQAELLNKYNIYKTQNNYPDYQGIYEGFEKGDQFIPYYMDFAVIEVDVDLNTANPTLATWINNATSALDQYITRMKTVEKLPNYLKNSGFMPTVDYLSVSKNTTDQSALYTQGLSNAQNLYIAGYPQDSLITSWMKNNPEERNNANITSYFRISNNRDAFAFAKNDVDAKLENGVGSIYTKVWNRVLADSYGYNYFIRFSSLFYGASGSVVYNDFGQVVGIYNGVGNVTYGDLLKTATMAPLLQAQNITTSDNKIIYAYNLIDGSNKAQFAMQSASYRENLQAVYGKNAFKTALFVEGI